MQIQIAAAYSGPPHRATAPATSARSPGVTANPRRILVVEDNIDDARMLALLFAQMGHQVEYAINGIVAVEIAHRFLPELVFLDLRLPDAHGSEVARQLRGNRHLAATRIYAITGVRSEVDHQRALVSGCNAVLVKPVLSTTLEALIEGV